MDRIVNRIISSEEHAFICDQIDQKQNTATLRTNSLKSMGRHDDLTETIATDHLTPEYAVKMRATAAGVLHIYQVEYSDGEQGVVFTNTVFPDGKFNIVPGWSAGSIAFGLRGIAARMPRID